MRNAFFIYDCWLLTCPSYSTKIAMKMSRVSDKNKEIVEEKDELSESDIEEEEEDEEEDETEVPENEEASQMYRNSSLGL